MKLIITADDFGATIAVADGICNVARNGIITQTGLFANMDCAEYAVRRISEYPHVSLGIDLNCCAGHPVSDPAKVPTLLQEDGHFLTSRMHRVKEIEHPHSVSYDEIYMEFENQILRFRELTGKLPAYLQGHAWGNEETERATQALSEKYGIRTFTYYMEKYINRGDGDPLEMESFIEGYWARPKTLPDQSKDYGVLTQIENDPLEMFINGQLCYLDKALENDWICEIHTHSGFVDRDLIEESSYTMVRAMEAGFLCSDEFKDWVRKNDIELTSFDKLEKGDEDEA